MLHSDRGSPNEGSTLLSKRVMAQFLKQMGDLLTPEIAGTAIVGLVRGDPATTAPP